jgi:hypothetical protein
MAEGQHIFVVYWDCTVIVFQRTWAAIRPRRRVALDAMRSVWPAVRACFAGQKEFPISFIFGFISDKTQDSSYDISDDQFPWLGDHQTPPYALYTLDQFRGICGSKGRDYSKK